MILKVLLPNGRTRNYSASWDREEAPLGYRVLVPTRKGGTTAVVVGVEEGETSQSVISLPDEAPLLSPEALSFVEELSADYLIPKGVLLFKLLPSAFLWREEELVVVSERKPYGLDKRSLELVEYVKKRGGVKVENLKKRYDSSLVNLLLKKGFLKLARRWKAPDVEERLYSLAVPLGEALKRVRSRRKRRLLVFLGGKESVREEELLSWGFSRSDLRDLLKKGILTTENIPLPEKVHTPKWKRLLRDIHSKRLLLWSSFRGSLNRLVSLSAKNLDLGKSSLILFPDYGELQASLEVLYEQLGDQVVEIHSRVGAKKTYENWFRAGKEPVVVVGTYTALLCPAKELTSVVLSDESSPGNKLRYAGGVDMRRACFLLSRKVGTNLTFTTPAPSLSSYYLIKKGGMEFERERASAEVKLIKREPAEVLTQELYNLLKSEPSRETLFLVPKHGYSYAYCPRCEALTECPECGTFLTYSLKREVLYCTNCRYRQEELLCPECEGELEEAGFGLEKAMEVVEENLGLRENFYFSTHPHWEISYEMVVVLSADSLLSVPSYRAKEELLLYLLRAQNVAGSLLIVQTMFPEEEPFRSFAEDDVEGVYDGELEERERELLPPFWRLLLIKTTNPELERYVFKVVSPNVKSTYNVREECYEFLIRFRDRRTLFKVKQLLKRFPKDIIEVKVDPF
ncbi:hypothetical protein [Hydrogenivirga sp. 128-5-R1-1]|uniref:primosomal protein N' family DNA-binding protein n=1 Tax=Hydrogenivirga sp. 128-5-R1-1 TaxID=392423 RepID=UPI00015EF7BC|nr:hypothetical protein [Hydrogenivirga sp. 128-5-R1-1]EDP75752.1 hypothetical protein HG1285_17350 [Hydrogenivirga sp. 128-5-R1-1]